MGENTVPQEDKNIEMSTIINNMKPTIPSELLSKIDKNETPISWLYKTIFFDNKWNWYILIIMGCFGIPVYLILFDKVLEFDHIIIFFSSVIFSIFFLFYREKVFLKIYSKEFKLNHYYDNE